MVGGCNWVLAGLLAGAIGIWEVEAVWVWEGFWWGQLGFQDGLGGGGLCLGSCRWWRMGFERIWVVAVSVWEGLGAGEWGFWTNLDGGEWDFGVVWGLRGR